MERQEFSIQCNDIELFYRVYGDGPVLLLLHGFLASGELWNPYIPVLSSLFRVIVPDLRGHGRSTNPSRQFTHRQSALDIYALLDQCQVKTFFAAGLSSGGMTLLHMATQQPGRVKAMILLAATSYFPEQCRAICRSVTVPDQADPWLGELRATHVYGDGQIRDLVAQFHGFSTSYDDMNFTPPYLSTISAHTLIVHGDRDEFFPIAIPVEMYGAIPNSALRIVPKARHNLSQLWRVPAVVAQDGTDPALEFLCAEKSAG